MSFLSAAREGLKHSLETRKSPELVTHNDQEFEPGGEKKLAVVGVHHQHVRTMEVHVSLFLLQKNVRRPSWP